MTGIEAVQSRIAEIQATVQGLASLATEGSSSTSTSAAARALTSTTELSFADILAASTDATDTTSTDATATTSAATATTSAGAGTGQALVDAAEQYVGVPYVWGGTNPATGLDCSGLVQRAMADVGVTVPRVARDQAKLGTAVASLDQAKPGDLLVFDGGSHIGIYVGDGRMVDSPKPGKSVAVRDVYETPTAIRRVLPQTSTSATTAASTSVSSLAGASTTTADLQRYALTLMTEATAA